MNTPDEILRKHEDANEMHFHEVDRKFIIEAMKEYAKEKSEKPINLEISDEEIFNEAEENTQSLEMEIGFMQGAKWYREQLKNQ